MGHESLADELRGLAQATGPVSKREKIERLEAEVDTLRARVRVMETQRDEAIIQFREALKTLNRVRYVPIEKPPPDG